MTHILPDTTTLTVLSFNCWGLRIPWKSNDRAARMRAIRETLFQDRKYDVICLQEVWDKGDFEGFQLEASQHGVFPHSHYFYSGVFGSGVCIFSQWPIEEVLFYKWQVNGYIHRIFHGDWYGGKGIGLCVLNVKGLRVNVYTCHTHAEYSDDAQYLTHRIVQAFDIAQFIRLTGHAADLVVLGADLNSKPDELCFKIITEYADLTDSFQHEGVQFSGTFACLRNTYAEPKSVKKNPQGDRLDYILFKGGVRTDVECLEYCTPLEPKVPDSTFSYSDHEAICADFRVTRKSSLLYVDSGANIVDLRCHRAKRSEACLQEAYDTCNVAAEKLFKNFKFYQKTCITMSLVFIISVTMFLLFVYDEQMRLYGVLSLMLSFAVTVLSLCVFIWKRMEYHGILCAAHGMKLSLGTEKKCAGDKEAFYP